MVSAIKVSGMARTGTNYLRGLIQKNVIDCTMLSEESFDIRHTAIPVGDRIDGRFFDRGEVVDLSLPPESEGIKLDSFLWLICTKHPYLLIASSIKYTEFNESGAFWDLSNTEQIDCISKWVSRYMSYLNYVHIAIHMGLVAYVRYEDVLNDWRLVLRDLSERYSIDMHHPLRRFNGKHLPGGSSRGYETYRVLYLEERVHMVHIAKWKELVDAETDWDLASNFAYSKAETLILQKPHE